MPEPQATLVTKLFAPPPLRRAVQRPRLLSKLAGAAEVTLTLVTAPAGYGKTSLVAAWLGEVDTPSAWFSVDEGDNGEVRFWHYVASALEGASPGHFAALAEHLEAPQFVPNTFLTDLLNLLSTLARDLILVLDDYHLIESSDVQSGVTFLLAHAPPRFHLVVTSRSEPPLPLAKLRVQGRLLELRADELRFTREEIVTFFNRANVPLTEANLSTLVARTQGWVAALQLAALSLERADDAVGLVETLAGMDRFVFDYLAEEVLSKQTPEVQAFLLRTALLERFNAGLCAFVSSGAVAEGANDGVTEEAHAASRRMIQQLVRANLFVTALDASGTWFCLHPLFAEFLQRRFKETTPERVPEVYIRAARWCEAQGLTGEAVRYILAGGDTEGAVALVEQHDHTLLWRRDGRTTLRPWLDALPEDVIRARARLSLDDAWLLLGTPDTARLEQRLSDAERLLGPKVTEPRGGARASGEASGAQVGDMRGELAVLRTERLVEQGAYSAALGHLENALSLLTHPLLRGAALQSKGYLLRTKGDLEGAETTLVAAAEVCAAAGNLTLSTFALSDLGEVYKMRGALRKAAQTFERALLLARQEGRYLVSASGALIGLADVLREQNRLEEADARLREGLRLAERARYGSVRIYGAHVLARLRYARGEDALATLGEALGEAQPRTFRRSLETHHALLHLYRGDTTSAARSLQKSSYSGNKTAGKEVAASLGALVQARFALVSGDVAGARERLTKILERAEAMGRKGRTLAALVLQATVLDAAGETAEALAALERALNLARSEGYVRVFLDEGEPLKVLLQKLVVRGDAPSYALTLLDFPNTRVDTPATTLLTERERQILALVARGLSNGAIAETLIRSVGTVKSHTSSIYSKLGVRGRTEAVARARGLGLLE